MDRRQECIERLNGLQRKVRDSDVQAFLVTAQESIYYLTGASYRPEERPFFLIIWPNAAPILVVPMLEKEHMTKANIGSVTTYWDYPAPAGAGWADVLANILDDVKTLGVEPTLSLAVAERLKHLSPEPLPLVENMRLVKSPAEIESIRRTSKYAELGMARVMKASYVGATVLETFSESRSVQAAVVKDGDFDPIVSAFLTVAFPAPFSAQPHGIPNADDRLGEGPVVAMVYVRANGYAAELERTCFLRPPSQDARELFEHMLHARRKAFDLVKPGASCSEIDGAANNYLREQGLGSYLLHRTGHGIGLGNHEGPYVAEGSSDVLEENMVISIEPGIYVPEIGGFRHSDTVLVTRSGAERLTQYPTDIESLTTSTYKMIRRTRGMIIRNAMGLN